MMHFKEHYRQYLLRLSQQLFANTKRLNETERQHLTNHRGISGINKKSKAFCYTPVAKEFKGAEMIDVDGNRFIDISMGFGVHLFGHHPSFISERIQQANADSWGLGPYHPEMFQLAKSLCQLTHNERVSFFNSGTEAIMVAIRLARAYTIKQKIVIFKGAYHGHLDATLVFKTDPMSGLPLALIPGIPSSAQADTILLDVDQEDSLQFIQTHADDIAAVLVEPVRSRHPNSQPKAFYEQLRTITKNQHIALIFDEMITGFRIHPAGAQAYFGIQADIVTYGKVIGGGMPIGIVAGKADYLDLIDGGQWHYDDDSLPQSKKTFVAGTFCNHPLSVAAANAVVDKLLEEGEQLSTQLNETTRQFVQQVNAWMESEKIPIRLHHFGSLFRIEAPSTAKLFYRHLLLEGVYVWEGKTCFLSTAHSPEIIEQLQQKIKKCALFLKACGFFPAALKIDHIPLNGQESDPSLLAHTIGLSVRVDGRLSPDVLEMAFRYCCLNQAQLSDVNFATAITRNSVTNQTQTASRLQAFIDRDISVNGIALLMISHEDCLSHFAICVHKSFLDGWSLSTLMHQLTDYSKSLNKGSQLTDIQITKQQRQKYPIRYQIDLISPVYLAKKHSYLLDTQYMHLKKLARKSNTNPLHFLMAAFALAYQQTLAKESTKNIVIGTPVAQQFASNKSTELGNFTIIQSKNYPLQASSLEDYLQQVTDSPQKATCILNIDRLLAYDQGGDFSLTPTPLDPSLIRYDVVINLMTGRKDGVLLDIKWNTEKFTEEQINAFSQLFMKIAQFTNIPKRHTL